MVGGVGGGRVMWLVVKELDVGYGGVSGVGVLCERGGGE